MTAPAPADVDDDVVARRHADVVRAIVDEAPAITADQVALLRSAGLVPRTREERPT